MATVNDIFTFIDKIAPFSTQMSFDNAGFLVGRGGQVVTQILVALDITEAVVDEAAQLGAELIVSHHPVIFHPVKAMTDADPVGRRLLSLAEHGISAICAHTNLDAARGGVNDALAARLGLVDVTLLETDGCGDDGLPYGIGRVGVLPGRETRSVTAFAALVKERLGAVSLRYADAGRPVRRIAVGGGACGSMWATAVALDCDTFVTADVKYDSFLDAKSMGLNLMDAGHFSTENVVCPILVRKLAVAFPAVSVVQSSRHAEVFSSL